jgi:hypothetical protein
MAELPAFSTIEYAQKGEKVSCIGILSAMAKFGYVPGLVRRFWVYSMPDVQRRYAFIDPAYSCAASSGDLVASVGGVAS